MRGGFEFDLGDEEIDGDVQYELFQYSEMCDPHGPHDAVRQRARERKVRQQRFSRCILAPPGEAAIFDHKVMFRQLDEVAAPSDALEAEDAIETSENRLNSEEYIRVQALDRLARDPRGPFRPLLMVKDDGLIEQVRAIAAEAPHFSEAIEIVARAAMLARATGTPLQLPNLLLAGPPGVGKTWFSKRLAAAIGTNTESIAGNAITDAALLLGHPSSWKGAKQGLVTDILVRSRSASPIILLNEVDKLKTHHSEDPFNMLLTLLEPENALKAMDEYLHVPFDLSRIIWILTANDLDRIPEPILDRTLVLHIDPPDGDRFADLVRNIFRETVRRFGDPPYTASDAVIGRLAMKRPRRIVRLIELALGYAAEAERREVTVDDIEKAEVLFSAPEPEPEPIKMGFVPVMAVGKALDAN